MIAFFVSKYIRFTLFTSFVASIGLIADLIAISSTVSTRYTRFSCELLLYGLHLRTNDNKFSIEISRYFSFLFKNIFLQKFAALHRVKNKKLINIFQKCRSRLIVGKNKFQFHFKSNFLRNNRAQKYLNTREAIAISSH